VTIWYFPQQVGVELRPGGFLALAVPFLFKPVAYLGKGAGPGGLHGRHLHQVQPIGRRDWSRPVAGLARKDHPRERSAELVSEGMIPASLSAVALTRTIRASVIPHPRIEARVGPAHQKTRHDMEES
jgi:hypothetical protein